MTGFNEVTQLNQSTNANQSRALAPEREANADDVARFNEALTKQDPKKQAESNQAEPNRLQGSEPNLGTAFEQPAALSSKGQALENGLPQGSASELSSIFSALMSKQPDQAVTNPINASSNGPTNAALTEAQQQLSSGIVDRILVADSSLGQGSEVRLFLGASVAPLDGVEITLRRNLEGMLAVELNSQNHKQFQKLVELRPALVEALEEHEHSPVTIILNQQGDHSENERRFNEQLYS